jgi:hypothetical protein
MLHIALVMYAGPSYTHAGYAGYTSDVEYGWDGFRRQCGDRTSPHTQTSTDSTWQHIPSDPVGIQDAGSTKADQNGIQRRLDGAVGNDMTRGAAFQWPPVWTQYPWVGLGGMIGATLIFSRAGYPAWNLKDSAVKRAADYLKFLEDNTTGDWYSATRSSPGKWLINLVYGLNYPGNVPTLNDTIYRYTDWTHPNIASTSDQTGGANDFFKSLTASVGFTGSTIGVSSDPNQSISLSNQGVLSIVGDLVVNYNQSGLGFRARHLHPPAETE